MRLIEVTVPLSGGEVRADELADLLEGTEVVDRWTVQEGPERLVARILVPKEGAEAVTDRLSERFEGRDGFRIVLLPVEATLPMPYVEETEAEGEAAAESEEDAPTPRPSRVSREELYEDLWGAAQPGAVYFVTVALATVVAAVGLIRGDVAVIVGAMVIAPLLGPNVAISLASTLGDASLARRAVRSAAGGAALSLLIAVLFGVLLGVDPVEPEIVRRTAPGPGDVALALAAGSAGALAYTGGLPTAVIGVMVAVALLPPLVVLGLMLGGGHTVPAMGALLLVVTNVVCLNLAGVTTFLVQRVRPRNWWEEQKAKQATRRAVLSWLVMLGALVWILMWIS